VKAGANRSSLPSESRQHRREFESKLLKVEKVIAAAQSRLKAQTKGSGKFFGEYNEKIAQGVLIAE
jgi:hypothetical protein